MHIYIVVFSLLLEQLYGTIGTVRGRGACSQQVARLFHQVGYIYVHVYIYRCIYVYRRRPFGAPHSRRLHPVAGESLWNNRHRTGQGGVQSANGATVAPGGIYTYTYTYKYTDVYIYIAASILQSEQLYGGLTRRYSTGKGYTYKYTHIYIYIYIDVHIYAYRYRCFYSAT